MYLWKEVSSGASYIGILNQQSILWILTRNVIAPTFLMAQIMILYGNICISMIDSRNDSGMLDSEFYFIHIFYLMFTQELHIIIHI